MSYHCDSDSDYDSDCEPYFKCDQCRIKFYLDMLKEDGPRNLCTDCFDRKQRKILKHARPLGNQDNEEFLKKTIEERDDLYKVLSDDSGATGILMKDFTVRQQYILQAAFRRLKFQNNPNVYKKELITVFEQLSFVPYEFM